MTKELDNLCLNNLFGLSIPDNAFDDWANEEQGYSWTKNGKFTEVEDRKCYEEGKFYPNEVSSRTLKAA